MKPNTGKEKKLQGIFPAVGIGLMVLAVAFPTPARAQDKPADNLQTLRKMAFQGPGHILRFHPLFTVRELRRVPGGGVIRIFSAGISPRGRLRPTTGDVKRVMTVDG